MKKTVVELSHLLDVDEVAKILKVDPKAVYDMRYQEKIPYTKIGGRLRFDPVKIKEFIEKNSHTPEIRTIDFGDTVE
ncbi:MAG: helix-turn-helix domain-containing protein [Candidatus Hinthialibacter antarcticus]|nr:helix-turn-helix domain-containing protein [Candidatus Hinthialibacter antarcticus]